MLSIKVELATRDEKQHPVTAFKVRHTNHARGNRFIPSLFCKKKVFRFDWPIHWWYVCHIFDDHKVIYGYTFKISLSGKAIPIITTAKKLILSVTLQRSVLKLLLFTCGWMIHFIGISSTKSALSLHKVVPRTFTDACFILKVLTGNTVVYHR